MVRKLSRGGVALAAGLVALPLVAACSGGGDEAKGKASPVAAAVAPAKVEVIAELTGCEVKIRTEAEELREGVCQTSAGDYLITTFPKEKLKEVWLESASMYGGKYLVGPQWAISAKPPVLKKLKAKVGGTIRDLSQPSAS
ncbi:MULTISPECIES: hypothetical protein [Streptomyces]|jgi:hypothetical protein|uniref:Lipoprotein n=1 Tax=Streptomyces scabiei (strain 87.22) TaxID=680198 RepID=C9Z8M7_STRSW|nr:MULTISPECIES: hypothetical protein [Streptomyces]MBP5862481.1 hypothetical protein [Streptomyces sp. LBUM 1484]MBP5868569.1 hypothetical protein [Streptomyces sp. LBUM 1485]MBP5907122.1 hypothetical protein [Streptomyces sp. LBUM 1478]MBP5930035.1 hypothetical protein [Streptomyces sp. LBUM 1479]KFG10236.1 hypothetical protein IQ61_03855 [Streptomyces scabiei]